MSLTKAIINLKNLKENLDYLKSIAKNANIYPVIKANAYGHGLLKIAKFLDKEKIKGVCVATENELEELIKLNLSFSILHLGKISYSNINLYKNKNTIATINSQNDLEQINKLCDKNFKIRAHIKIDTGMSRMGCSIHEFKYIFDSCMSNDNIILEGIYSHLANSDNSKVLYNDFQIQLFKDILKIIDLNKYPLKIHLLSSGGLFNFKDLKYDIVRSGISVYGISPLGYPHNQLKPVMTLTAPIVLNKKIKKGTMVGYGCAFKAKKDMQISIVQCGYGDGIPYEFSNKGVVFYNEKKMKILGKVSMDLICVDSSGINCEIGDEIIVWGGISDESRLEHIAKKFNNVPYTYVTGLTNRILREYIDE